jgi:hypothetical protein
MVLKARDKAGSGESSITDEEAREVLHKLRSVHRTALLEESQQQQQEQHQDHSDQDHEDDQAPQTPPALTRPTCVPALPLDEVPTSSGTSDLPFLRSRSLGQFEATGSDDSDEVLSFLLHGQSNGMQ